VQIETKKDTDPSVDRVVTVKGNPEACWRVSSCSRAFTYYPQTIDYVSAVICWLFFLWVYYA